VVDPAAAGSGAAVPAPVVSIDWNPLHEVRPSDSERGNPLTEELKEELWDLREQNDRLTKTLAALVATLPKCVRGCRRLATTTDGDGMYHCEPHRPPSELTVNVELPWAKLVREGKIPVQP
jgi:hypothetical protein